MLYFLVELCIFDAVKCILNSSEIDPGSLSALQVATESQRELGNKYATVWIIISSLVESV